MIIFPRSLEHHKSAVDLVGLVVTIPVGMFHSQQVVSETGRIT